MKSWIKLSAAGLAASLLLACGGGGDTDPGGVTPLGQLQPGERFAMETPLLPSGSQISHYVVHGVTPEGALVESDRPGLLAGVRVSVLESVTRDGRSSTSVANPDTLKQQQQAFYQQLWNATAEHEGTRDPQAILAEIDDLDTRIVDLMDDVTASGVTLKEYIAFYDRLDAIPELAGKELAELNLREALSDVDKVSVLKSTPTKCPDGQILVISQSRLFSYCRVQQPPTWKALADLPTKASIALDKLPEPSLSAVIAALGTESDFEALMITVTLDRINVMDAAIAAQFQSLEEKSRRAAQLRSALSQNRQNDQEWTTYCAQHPDLRCVSSDTPNFGAVMAQRVQEMLDAMQSTSQMDQFRLQSLFSRWNEAMEIHSDLLRKTADARLAIISNMR